MSAKQKATTSKKEPEHSIDLKVFREMIGKWEVGPLYSMGGESQTGKTTLALQLMAEYSHKTGKTACIFDTEGGAQKFVDAWMPVHKKKYPKAKVIVITCRTWQKILSMHGIETSESISDAGKVKVTVEGHKEDSKLAKLIDKHEIGWILYDSFTMPMQAFGYNQENFPVRNTVQQMWMHKMIELSDDMGVLIMLTNHMTKNPANPYAPAKLAGGKAIHHNCKVQFFIKRWEAKGVTDFRTVVLHRYYDVDKGGKKGHLQLTNDGYFDRTDEELTASKAKARKAS